MLNRVNAHLTVSTARREETEDAPATPKTRNLNEIYASTTELPTRESTGASGMQQLRTSLPSNAYQAAEKQDPRAAQAAQNLLQLQNWKR
ncbi:MULTISPECIES: hypothetical protein [Bacteria]|uniref:Uncharacterized protein n=1 Tax=Myxococcus xanthus TaxID=34 RepID=A0A7Y4IRF2_MYXXA|nr:MULTISPECIES: hypothetical protein [Bacteria]MDT0136940.1 hypothetical protein [Acidovorax sp. PRC11]NOJ83959.1 hypothetical protein [Myxococcus xanthus]